MQPAARISDMHACSLHGGGPIITGAPTVIVCGMPSARISDLALCPPAVDVIVEGCPTILVCGMPPAYIGCKTAHGGVVVQGCPTVLICTSPQCACMSAAKKAGRPFVEQAGGNGSPGAQGGQGQQQASDPLNDPNVKAGMKQAAKDSDIGGGNPKEQGGFILKDPKTGNLSVERWPTGQSSSMSPPISTDGKYNGKDIVGSFHTHPNVGQGWKQEPSTTDTSFVTNYPKTAGDNHYVISKDKVYRIDSGASVSDAGKTGDILK